MAIISMSGTPGSGKSTVGKLLAEKLEYEKYNIGQFRRDAAKARGMTLDEYNKLGETDPNTDNEADEYQKKLGEEKDNFLIEARLAYHFIPHSIKLFLSVSLDEAAKRIFHDESAIRNEATAESVAEKKEILKKRMTSDSKRYIKYYGVDCYDESQFDYVIDTTDLTPGEVLDKILEYLKGKI